VNWGTRFGASGNDSSETDVGRVEGCSEDGGLEAVAVGEIDSDIALPGNCWGGEVCGVIALDFGSCFDAAVGSIEGSLEQESRGVRGGE
jgi:hypothetical protein